MTLPSRRWLGIVLVTGGTLLLSTESIVLRWLERAEPSPSAPTVVAGVGVLTAVSALCLRLLRGGPVALTAAVRSGGPDLIVAGGLQAMSTLLFVAAVAVAPVADVVAVLAAAPLLTALVGVVWLGERPRRAVWSGIALSGLGVLVIAAGSVGGGSIAGVLAAAGAVGAFAVGVGVLRRRPELDRVAVVAVAGVTMAVVTAPFARPGLLTLGTAALIALLGIVIGPASRWMISTAPRHLPAAQIGLFIPLETVAATSWAYLAFDEVPAATTWWGAALILLGVVLAATQSAL